MMALALASLSCLVWIYLLAGRGGFWRSAERLDDGPQPSGESRTWPSVVALVPARDEAHVIAQNLSSLLMQDYPGEFSVVLVDDHSSDGTAEAARLAAPETAGGARLTIIAAPDLPQGWTGKLWALKNGMAAVAKAKLEPDYFWMTDADIVCGPDTLRVLVSKAGAEGLVLTSVMAKLRTESLSEKALIPAFVFFFQMLYPFAWVNDPRRGTGAAAGGCMLVRREALDTSGGLEAMRSQLIDDCALARQLKAVGPIWVGFSARVVSVRAYGTLQELRRMIARTAYCQLRYSPLLLGLTAVAMSITFLVPPVLALGASGAARVFAICAWVAMTAAFQPTLRRYKASPACGLGLPAMAAAYLFFTMDSAFQHSRARGGMWKGRAQARECDAR